MNEDMIRGFHWSTRAWYSSVAGSDKPEVVFGMYHPSEGGTTGEMAMRWHNLSGGDYNVPRLEVFDDAWRVLRAFDDVLERLAHVDGQNITEGEFVALLLECGFTDLTEYDNPYKERIEQLTRARQAGPALLAAAEEALEHLETCGNGFSVVAACVALHKAVDGVKNGGTR